MPLEDCWRYIRASRANPPGYAGKGQRKAVYAAAMKQAQQLFTSSDSVGYEIKPMLLYYGLNQAVRGLAAMGMMPKEPWTFSNHGIGSNIEENPELGKLKTWGKGEGAIQMLARLCESPSLPADPVELGDLWSSLPAGGSLAGTTPAWALGLGGLGQVLGRLGYTRLAAATSVRLRGVLILAITAIATACSVRCPGPAGLLIAAAMLAGSSSWWIAATISGKYRPRGRCWRDCNATPSRWQKAMQRKPSNFGSNAQLPGRSSGN
jgi:hypothetical protein